MALSAVVVAAPSANAQNASDPTTAPVDSATAKQAQKAQRKVERKANGAKKNAELSQLEKNGYNPGGDQVDYPQNLQNAQKQGVRPASSPAPQGYWTQAQGVGVGPH
ncbi:hypothetical protein CUJ89_27825 [Burkholderia pyrrocinia]|uniref:DUF4148 domain-containing protein n=1 Tax=Burkholderia pyrrocinia TaxID=60550 RepID=A0A2Z5N5B0_BURPY|nr:hypothetical protein CUJ89_27825 [Burkholderia pyrrocinia]